MKGDFGSIDLKEIYPMKQIRDYIITLGLSFFFLTAMNAQSDCANPVVVSSLPFYTSGSTSSGTSFRASEFCGEGSDYDEKDYILKYTPLSDEYISINIGHDNFLTLCGIYIFTDCMLEPNECVAYAEGYQTAEASFVAEASQEYYIFVGTATTDNIFINITKEDVEGVAINKSAPTQTLDVNGAIRIGENTTTPFKGTLKWNETSNELQGYDGTKWESVKTRKLNELHEAIYDYGLASMYIGKGAGSENVNPPSISSYNTVAIGDSSLHHNGSGATQSFQGGQNVALGAKAGFENTTGSGNAYIGYRSGFNNETGHSNVALGNHALYFSKEQSNLVAIGDSALHFNGNVITTLPTGLYNTAIGSKAGLLNTTGSSNSFVGFEAGRNNVTGNRNSFFGFESGFTNLNGVDNTFLGYQAGYSNLSGKENTFIGVQSGVLNAGGNGNTFQGYFSGNRNTSGSDNTFIGHSAGRNNTTGDANLFIGREAGLNNNAGFSNLFIGQGAGKAGTTARSNLAIGKDALQSNTIMPGNIAIGDSSLYWLSAIGAITGYQDPGSFNTAVGLKSGYRTSVGDHNSFFGAYAGMRNEEGRNNSMFGFEAGADAVRGDKNVYVGTYAGKGCTACNNNTIIGYGAGSSLSGKDDNTFVGDNAGISLNGERNVAIGRAAGANLGSSNYENTITLGYNARVSASNQARIGNSSISSIGGYAAWSNLSDGRYKFNVKEDAPGLQFILGLRPVSYQINYEKLSSEEYADQDEVPASILRSAKKRSEALQSGFIAQEVEQLVREQSAAFDGVVIPKNKESNYALSYSTFVVPLVKAVQEQQEMIAELKSENENLDSENHNLRNRLEKIEAQINLLINTEAIQNEN